MKSNIPLFKVFMADTAGEEVSKVLNSGYIGQGPKVDAFEDDLKKYFCPNSKCWYLCITFSTPFTKKTNPKF